MNLVVERGVARCPRCVAVADYVFVECGPDAIRYDVRCRRCGEMYSELNSAGPMIFGTDMEQYVYCPRSQQLRAERMARLVDELHRLRSVSGEWRLAAGEQLSTTRQGWSAATTALTARVRDNVRERLAARSLKSAPGQ